MNKSNVINLLAALMFAACTSTPKSYVIEGVVPDTSYDNQMVYMYDLETKERVDSTLVIDGKFKLSGSVDNAVNMYLTLDKFYVDIILENGKISVNIAEQESVKGTPLNDVLSKYSSTVMLNQKELNEKCTEIIKIQDIDDESRSRLLNEIVIQSMAKHFSIQSEVFNANKNNAVGILSLLELSQNLDPNQWDLTFAQSGDIVRKFKPLQKVDERNANRKRTAEGMPFIDFTIENGNMDGSKVSLSDYVGKGKYVLVDFWASWCGPCIAEIPVLVEVYEKYKGDKFELLGVAVWDNREATLESIKRHNVLWPQIVDAGSIPTDLYGIRGIPHIILLGPDGKILARDLRGDDLKAKIAEVMK